MLKKIVFYLVLILLLSGCSRDKTEHITFSSWGSITESQIIESVIKNFEEKNPNIKIDFMLIPQNYFQKLHLLFASSTPPDVIFVNNLYLPLYKNEFMSLDEYINKSDYYIQAIKSLSLDNKLYAIPRDISTLIYYRNKNIINQIPKSVDDIQNCVLKDNKNNFSIGIENDMYYMLPFILTEHEDEFNPKKSYQIYKELKQKCSPADYQIGSSTLTQMFIDGKIGLYMSGRWMYPKLLEDVKFDWDIVDFPGVVQLDASGWAIAKDTKHKAAALKFVEYISSEDSINELTKTGLIIPARKKSAKLIKEKAFLSSIENSVPHIVDKNYKKQVDKLNKELFNK